MNALSIFKEHLMNAYEKLQQQNTNLSTVLCMVQESLQYMNDKNPIVK